MREVLWRDVKRVSREGVGRELGEEGVRRVQQQVREYREGLEAWVEVHRKQLARLREVIEKQGEWQSAVSRLVSRLASDYTGPILEFELSVNSVEVEYSPHLSLVTPSVLALYTQWVENIPGFFTSHLNSISRDLLRAWENPNSHQISLKSLTNDLDLVGIALLITHIQSTRSLVLTRCGYGVNTVTVLKEAFRRTAAELRTVDISDNALGDEGLRVVVEGLVAIRSLALVAVRNGGLGDGSVEVLGRLRGVKLDVGRNGFSVSGKERLMELNAENKV